MIDQQDTDAFVTAEGRINEAVKTLKLNETSGIWEIPETLKNSLNEVEQFAVMAEKRRRDQQSTLTKEQAKNIRLASEIEALKKQKELLVDTVTQQRTTAMLDNQDMGRYANNYQEYSNIVENTSMQAKEEILNAVEGTTKDVIMQAEVRAKESLLASYSSTFSNIDFTAMDSVMPLSTYRRLEQGEISYTDYLDEYVARQHTAVYNPKPPSIPSLGSVAGSSKNISSTTKLKITDVL